MKLEIQGFGTTLFLIFLILKLTHCISWSWWWVTCPLWFPLAFATFCTMVFITYKCFEVRDFK